MLAYLEGAILSKDKNSLVLLTKSGVGYEVKVAPTLFLRLKQGEIVRIHTYFHVREDSQELYGFSSPAELVFFKQLISVNGVGPRSALHIMALGSAEEIQTAISRGDMVFLTKVSGVGKKIAERIVVELKDKLAGGALAKDGVGSQLGDVIDALTEMGYSLAEAREAVKGVKESDNTSQILKQALKALNKRN